MCECVCVCIVRYVIVTGDILSRLIYTSPTRLHTPSHSSGITMWRAKNKSNHTHTHTYIHSFIHLCTFWSIHLHTLARTKKGIKSLSFIHSFTHICILTTHTHTHTQECPLSCAYTHTHTYPLTSILTPLQVPRRGCERRAWAVPCGVRGPCCRRRQCRAGGQAAACGWRWRAAAAEGTV